MRTKPSQPEQKTARRKKFMTSVMTVIVMVDF